MVDNSDCRTTQTFRVESNDATFFEARLHDLGGLFSAALRNAYAACPKLGDVRVKGYAGEVHLLSARAKGTDNWRLVLEVPELNKVAARIPEKIDGLEKLPKLLEMFAPFREVPGIAQTTGYSLFAQTGQTTVTQLAFADVTRFQRFVESLLTEKPRQAAQAEVEKVLEVVSAYNTPGANMLRARFDVLADAFAASQMTSAVADILNASTQIPEAVKRVSAQVEKWDPPPSLAAQTDGQLARWLDQKIETHEQAHPGSYLDDLRAHLEFVRVLETHAPHSALPQTGEMLETAAFWFDDFANEALSQHEQQAVALIDEAGTGYLDVDLVIETGLSLSKEFANFGFEEEAEALVSHAATRAESLIEDGRPGFRAALDQRQMTLDTIAELEEQALLFDALSADFPGFEGYAQDIEAAIDSGRVRACRALAAKVQTSQTAPPRFAIAGEETTLTDLSCALYANNHVLAAFDLRRNGTGQIDIDTRDGPRLSHALVTSETGALVGAEERWHGDLSALVIRPPTGAPDRNGITECDQWAGDPADPAQPTQGVDLERVSAEYDFDRALDACIAAVEFAPDAPRQAFQLARVLEFLGDADSAQHYVAVASAADYAPAQHLQAMFHLTYREDDDAFFDASDLFKAAAARGYGPSKAELKDLVPAGVELYRDIPEPTDRDMLNAFGTKQCEGVQGFAHACVHRNGVARKSCFQTSADAFSCEVVFRQRCEFSSFRDPLMDLFTGMINASCPSRSDTMFLKFTKTSSGWRARKEF
ncbi:hypothetical protein [Roseobacter sinensis]|uniref:Uncharacterized protein n=1 Tax=Roseobacter sinensis TaxID=2931391 RepID=A0ABT3BIQ9_9RHOB|nr:hypothetical protein [Roseobacter sp. WL0113]MCV3273461.1 hypothetical protein [Roseobacter sp. WL0113]